MKTYFTSILIIFLASLSSNGQGYLKAQGKNIENEQGQNVLLRGIGLGGWMLQEGYMLGINQEAQQHRIRQRMEDIIGVTKTAEFYETWLANFVTKADIDSLKSWGFNSVRLPMHYNLYTLPVEKEPVKGENTWLPKGFLLTDSLLSWCRSNGIYLILDLHATPGGQGNDLNIADRDPTKPTLWDDEANKQKTISLWKKLAERYVNEPWIGAYDIINEPNWGFSDPVNDKNGTKEPDNAPLRKLMVDITSAIRGVDKKHMIIVEGNGWGNNYNGIFPPWDSNMVLSYHKYWNKNDAGSIKNMIASRDKYNVPIWLGETGENSNVWFTEAIRLLEENNIGWAWWPLKKLGANNPLQIKSNTRYDQLANFWNKRGQKPTENDAYSGLLELASSAGIKKNIFHKDVIDAMFRQPFNAKSKPFTWNVIKDKLVIDAVDYDMGRNGVAYYDNDTADYHTSGQRGVGNRGRTYRNDGVDIRKDSVNANSYYVSDIEKGEWLQYSIDVTRKAVYNIKLTVSTDKSAGKVSISSGKSVVAKEVQLPVTAGQNDWQAVVVKNVSLNKGAQVLKLYAEEGGFNLKSIELSVIK